MANTNPETKTDVISDYIQKLPPNVIELKMRSLNPLFTVLRNKNTSNKDYIFYADRICRLLSEEGLAYLSTEMITIETPCGTCKGYKPIDTKNLCAVSIVRSGDILMEALRQIAPGISVGKILIQRQEHLAAKTPKHYYTKLPKNIKKMKVLLCDPMLGTGGSSTTALKILIDNGCKQENILFLNVVSCPEGIKRLYKEYPKVTIITCKVDPKMNDDKYIVPGVGDFGDRYYRTGNEN